MLVMFYLYVFLPFGDEHAIKREKGPWVKVLDLLLSLAFLLLALGIVTTMIMMTVLLAGIDSNLVNRKCGEEEEEECLTVSGAVFYGGWVTVAFKYLDLVKFLIVGVMTFRRK